MKPKVVGTVEILRARTYRLDPEAPESGGLEAIVYPGSFPLYRMDFTYFWLMEGFLSLGGMQRLGGGMFAIIPPGDIDSGVPVRFPSRRLDDEEFDELCREPLCKEGHPDQRLRIALQEGEG